MVNPSNWGLTGIGSDNEATDGQVFGGQLNDLIPYSIGNLPATFKVGVKYTNEHKGYFSNQPGYNYTGSNTLANYDGAYNVSNFYGHICGGCYQLAPFGSIPGVESSLHNDPGDFQFVPNLYNDRLATFAGTEQVTAAYAMQTLDVGQMHINVGLRAENTEVGYAAWTAPGVNDTTAGSLVVSHRSHSYTDLFPSVSLRYALDENTNLRAVFSRGIARPNYSDLAPSFNAVGAQPGLRSNGLSIGNPSLQPEKAWNYDLLAEHYFPSVGVISGGAFYKDISDFMFQRTFFYNGINTAYTPTGSCATNPVLNNCFYASQTQNGPSAHLWGVEADYTQHLTFLPGALKGIGFDVNWTHVESRATVPLDTTVVYTDQNGNNVHAYTQAFRHSPIPRQFPNIFNVSMLYDYSTISARMSGQYTSASIYQYGSDGTSNPASGDQWNYVHWQIDGSVVWTVYGATALQAQVLNLNNAVFGFFTGLPGNGHSWNNQREYYGTTWYFGVRQGL
jgi:TonB-dependent receptor